MKVFKAFLRFHRKDVFLIPFSALLLDSVWTICGGSSLVMTIRRMNLKNKGIKDDPFDIKI